MEKDIVLNAFENFTKHSGIQLRFGLDEFNKPGNDMSLDGEIHLKKNKKEYRFPFIAKRNLTLSKLPQISNFQTFGNLLVISDYIPKALKAHLREINVCYVDAAGNAFITDGKGLYLFIETNQINRITETESNRAFSKSGLKVVYQILIQKDTINLPYREIAKLSEVSIDTVGKVIKGLLKDQYLIRISDHKYKLKDQERLLQEWITLFNKVLRPKLKQKSFGLRYTGQKLQSLLELAPKGSIGGELGAEYLSKYLIAENAILYTKDSFVDMGKKLDLIPQKNGSIKIMESFWSSENQSQNKTTVDPLLVYADLLDNPNSRNLEAAKKIYNQYVQKTL